MYSIEFAPDGKHFQQIKNGKIDEMWNYFTQSADIVIQQQLNPFSKFRLRNVQTNKIIGEK